MCGFVGAFDKQGNAARLTQAVQRGSDAIEHRGPDDQGRFCDGPVAFGFRRLSILDLSPAGHQPMTSHDGAWTVVFNGEIYNFIELRSELAAAGVVFHSDCDTEVLVEALAAWGVSCFERFNGMWAVLAWHLPSQTLWACRGPWGIKPLFISDQGSWVAFSSEIKGLKAMGCDVGGVDPVGARRFLDNGELDTDTRTMFSGVERVDPGHRYRFRVGEPVQRIFYGDGTSGAELPRFSDDAQGERDYIDAFREAFLSSVRLRLRSDVDVGTCMSGGLDSTAIACAASRFLSAERVTNCRHAFTALLPEYDESRFIRPVLAQTGAEWHFTVADDAHVQSKIEHFFRVHDEPVHSLSALAGFLVMGLAAEAGVRVLLNGQGADELLGGYNSTIIPYVRSLIAEEGVGYAATQAVAEAGSVVAGIALLLRANAGLAARALPTPVEAALRANRARVAEREPGAVMAASNGPLALRQTPVQPPSDRLRATLQDQLHRSPLPLYLRIEDSNSSAYSIEARLPFLDPQVVALAMAAPARLLRRGGLNKFLLRRILPGLVPEVVWQRRDKMGFPVPHERWLRGPLRAMMYDTLASQRIADRGWFDKGSVERSLNRFMTDVKTPLPPTLLRALLLERWARDHLDPAGLA